MPQQLPEFVIPDFSSLEPSQSEPQADPVEPQPVPQEEISTPNRFRQLAGTGIRATSGVIGSIISGGGTVMSGGLGTPLAMAVGGTVGGAGELAAQFIEGSMDENTLKRVLVEAGLTAIPGGKLVKAGKPLISGLAGAGFSGVGMMTRGMAEDRAPGDIISEAGPWEIGNLALGGGLGAAAGKMSRGLKKPETKPVGKPPAPTVPTATVVKPSGERIPGGVLPHRSNLTGPAPTTGQQIEAEATGAKIGAEVASRKGVPEAKRAAKSNIQALKEATADVRESSTGKIMPPEQLNIQQGVQPGSRFAVANPSAADPTDILPDPTAIRATGLPEEASEATRRALNVPINKQQVRTRLQQERQKAGQAVKAEESADLQRQKALTEAEEAAEVGNKPAPQAKLAQKPQEAQASRVPQPKQGKKPVGTPVQQYQTAINRILEGVGESPAPVKPPVAGLPVAAPKSAPSAAPTPSPTLFGIVEGDEVRPTSYQGPERRVTPADVRAEFGRIAQKVRETTSEQMSPKIDDLFEASANQPDLPESFKPLLQGVGKGAQPISQAGFPARIYKTKVGAAGKAAGDFGRAKALGEPVNEEGKAVAKAALERIRQESGLPAKAAGKQPVKPIAQPAGQPIPVTGKGLAQTDKARRAAADPAVRARAAATRKASNAARREGLKGEKGEGAFNPLVAARLGGAVVGGVAGAASDPLDDTFLSTVAGAGAGAVAPDALQKVVQRGSVKGISDGLKAVAKKYPNYQRFAYLSDPASLLPNAVVGPWGSAVMGSIEKSLQGDKRGLKALKSLMGPKYLKGMWQSRGEAYDRLARAEGTAYQDASNSAERLLALPGHAMTMGDVSAKNILMKAGFSEDEARMMTLTSEPKSPTGKRWVHTSKKVDGREPWLGNVMFPFKRTPLNIAESGLERMPVVGPVLTRAISGVPVNVKEEFAKQGVSGAVGIAAWSLGAMVDEENAKWLRKYVSNGAGQYSMIASAAFAMGQASRTNRNQLGAAVAGVVRDAPLPSASIVLDWYKFMQKVNSGEFQGKEDMPPGTVPGVVKRLLP